MGRHDVVERDVNWLKTASHRTDALGGGMPHGMTLRSERSHPKDATSARGTEERGPPMNVTTWD